jgi:hypothetical protein
MENHQEIFGNEFVIDKEKLRFIFRFAVEEILRRQLDSNKESLTKKDLLKMLLRNSDTMIQDIKMKSA